MLGWFLLRTGKATQSLTLIADGKHVLSDSWTSLGVIIGLLLVRFTGIAWFDPLVAAIVGVNLGWTGFWLVRHAAGGLLDEEDTKLIGKLLKAFDAYRMPGIIRIHHLRAIRSGALPMWMPISWSRNIGRSTAPMSWPRASRTVS